MAVYRVTYSGVLGSAEVFSMGWSFEGPAGGAAAQLAACSTWLDDFWTTNVASCFNSSSTAAPGQTTFTRMRVVEIANTGVVITTAEQGVSKTGSQNYVPLPPQLCLVVSLRTGISGPGYRGRFSLPAPHANTLSPTSGKIASTQHGYLLAGLNTAFDNFTTSSRFPEIVSRGENGAITRVTAVTYLELGDVFDTMRTRRNKVAEVRTAHTIAV